MSSNAGAAEFVPQREPANDRPRPERKGRSGPNRRGRGRGNMTEGPQGRSSQGEPPGLRENLNTTTSAQHTESTVRKPVEPEEDDDDAEVCFICAEPIHFSAVTACNHRTCHICALRLRALYRNFTCAYCKTESKTILFTLPSEKPFSEYKPEDIAAKDEKLGISFEETSIMEETMILLRFNCPVDTCDVAAAGWPDLKLHIKQAHNQFLCDLCVKNKKVFTHEHELFSQKSLTNHYKNGDRDAQDDNGFKGHPECGFCRKAFYDDDELYKHCRDKHERCHVCDQMNNGPGRAQYFQDYKQLDQHFRRDHFVCPEPACLEQKFVVFGSELDLKAHQLEAHPNGLSGQALKDARKINTSFSGYEGPANARGNRGRRPEIQFQSSTSAGGHLSREQQALQRQFEYQQSRAQMSGFGYALSEPDPPPPQPAMQVPVPSAAVQQAPLVEAFPALSGQKPTMNNKSLQKTNVQTNVRAAAGSVKKGPPAQVSAGDLGKHQALLERVRMVTSFDDEKVALFKTNIAQFRSTNISAPELITNLSTLLKLQIDNLGSIVTGAADVLDNEGKRHDLLAAWNDWKIKNTPDKPALGGPSLANVASGGGQRVLSIKSRASRTASQTSSVWNQASASAPRGKDPISQASHKLAQLHMAGGRGSSYTPAWSASAAASKPGSGASTPARTAQVPAMEFPSLPSGRGRASTAQFFQNGGGWAQSGPSVQGSVIGPEDYEDEATGASHATKGKKKPKKQLLFSQGLQRG